MTLLQRVCTRTLCVRAVYALFVKWAKRNVGGTDTQCLTYVRLCARCNNVISNPFSKTMKVSFDFDGTLTLRPVQAFCATLIAAGHEVWITTMRYDNKHIDAMNARGRSVGYSNIDVFALCKKLGIKYEHVIFCNEGGRKTPFLMKHDFAFHLDDDSTIVHELSLTMPCLCIDVYVAGWQERCLAAMQEV